MYRYDEFDRQLVKARVIQFTDQLERYRSGALTDDEFAPLRLQNGLYLQRHAYMLRVAIPYGTLSAVQMRALADIADRYDRGYGHFTTRQNIQFNWLQLDSVPALLGDLADVDMHAIQTSGNCIRNITCDPYAGVAADEVEDPRPSAELLRQWSALHPEFAFLPRKFKIAITGSSADRAAIYFHDIGIRLVRNERDEVGYEIIVGGGQGRTPIIGQMLKPFVSRPDLLPYLESVLRVYNLHGRRDNKYKARIKILVKSLGLQAFAAEVEADFFGADHAAFALAAVEFERIERYFSPPAHTSATAERPLQVPLADGYSRWLEHNVHAHKAADRAIAIVTLKSPDRAPGDASSQEMRLLADLAARYSSDEIRITHEQNIVLPHVHSVDLFALWQALDAHGLGGADHRLITDIIACPGLDYCNLASTRSIPLAKAIARRFSDAAQQTDLGPLSIKISGCMNACGHHHVGNIGILGVEKNGREVYQLTLGGEAAAEPGLGERLGPAIEADEVVQAIATLTGHYRETRTEGETFLETLRRVGTGTFKAALYDAHR
jgi:sulfite reductase (NADPH) hemoprotein beta-component